MIDIRNLERSYKTGAGQTWVLRRIDLKIERGEFVTLMGPSGAGKSSLLNAIALLDDQWLGEYYFEDAPVHAMGRKQRAELAKRSMGMVFQSYHLLDELTVAENIDLPLSYKNMPRAERQGWWPTRWTASTSSARKTCFRRNFPADSSNWSALRAPSSTIPPLLLADEPTGNLHSEQAKEIMELFKELNRQGTTILQVTHSETNAAYGNRLLEVRDGWLVSDSSNPRL